MRTLDVPGSQLLDTVVGEVEAAAAALRSVAPAPAEVVARRDRAAVASLRLDGSPIEEVPTRVEDLPSGTATGPARGGWLEVLRAGGEGLEEAPDAVVLAIEHRGVRAGLDADDLAVPLRTDPVRALAELHARMTEGLLAPEVAGRPRRTAQAVHDASVGRVLFFPVEPDQVERRTARLAAWLQDTDAHPVVVAGVLHHQLLDVHPFEAANGRLARTAARLLLAAAGIDAPRVGQPEEQLLRDSIGYLDEVGRSRRLGSPESFVVRWAEAVADGLRSSSRELGATPDTEVSAGMARFLAERTGTRLTLADVRRAGLQDELAAAFELGLVRRLHGTRGLRWEVPAGPTGTDAGHPADGAGA